MVIAPPSESGVHPAPVHRGWVYLLLGKDEFLKKEFVQNLKKNTFPGSANLDLNFQEFHAENDSLSDFFDFVKTAPFLSEKRMAVLWEVEELDDDEKERALSLVEQGVPGSSVVVFVSQEANAKKNSFLKDLSEKSKAVTLNPPFENELPLWIENRLKKEAKTIERPATLLMIERVGSDISSLIQAVEQLVLYTHPRNQISAKDVESLLGRSGEADVYELVDALLEKDAVGSFKILSVLLREGTRAYEIVGTVAGQFDRLIKALYLSEAGWTPADIGAASRVHSFFMEKFMRQVKKLSRPRIAETLEKLRTCDDAIKTGKLNEELALERLVLELCAK